ncbi:MAG TPA: hypothetical protein VHL80_04660 [Polyangia bacterium]|nr:hypothetical protein [Polyangia bacterium]
MVDDADITPTSNRTATTHAAVPEDLTDDEHSRRTQDHASHLDTLRTAEINVERDRRNTLTSPISALIAESMTDVSEVPAGRDPAAPRPESHGGHELTRRVGDSDRAPTPRERSQGYKVEVSNDPNARARLRAAHLIDQARALLSSGALAGAVVAAEQAFDEAERAAPPGIAEVIEPARPLFAQIFSSYVGSLDEVPVVAKRMQDIPIAVLDDRRRAFIGLVDGVRSVGQILDAARLHGEGLRIAASLLRAGIIRVV